MGEKKVMTVMEAAAELGISKGSAYEAARTGVIPTIRIGRRLLVPRVAFDRMLEQAGEPERRKVPVGDFPPGLGQGRQFRVGRRQHHDVARGLAQVDPMAAVVDGAGLGDKQMHGVPPNPSAPRGR